MNIICPNCKSTLILSSEVNKLLPFKRFGISEVQCQSCGKSSTSSLKSRSIWFTAFIATLILLMLAGKQLAHLAGYSSGVSSIVLVIIYIFVNWLFSYVWPKVISIELKDSPE